MAYKINGTTVVDNSRNVCACCVTSCCITASTRMDAPSGTTAQRPASPATGSIYFDTDLGSLVSYDGTTWGSVGGGSSGLPNDLNATTDEPWAYMNLSKICGDWFAICCFYCPHRPGYGYPLLNPCNVFECSHCPCPEFCGQAHFRINGQTDNALRDQNCLKVCGFHLEVGRASYEASYTAFYGKQFENVPGCLCLCTGRPIGHTVWCDGSVTFMSDPQCTFAGKPDVYFCRICDILWMQPKTTNISAKGGIALQDLPTRTNSPACSCNCFGSFTQDDFYFQPYFYQSRHGPSPFVPFKLCYWGYCDACFFTQEAQFVTSPDTFLSPNEQVCNFAFEFATCGSAACRPQHSFSRFHTAATFMWKPVSYNGNTDVTMTPIETCIFRRFGNVALVSRRTDIWGGGLPRFACHYVDQVYCNVGGTYVIDCGASGVSRKAQNPTCCPMLLVPRCSLVYCNSVASGITCCSEPPNNESTMFFSKDGEKIWSLQFACACTGLCQCLFQSTGCLFLTNRALFSTEICRVNATKCTRVILEPTCMPPYHCKRGCTYGTHNVPYLNGQMCTYGCCITVTKYSNTQFHNNADNMHTCNQTRQTLPFGIGCWSYNSNKYYIQMDGGACPMKDPLGRVWTFDGDTGSIACALNYKSMLGQTSWASNAAVRGAIFSLFTTTPSGMGSKFFPCTTELCKLIGGTIIGDWCAYVLSVTGNADESLTSHCLGYHLGRTYGTNFNCACQGVLTHVGPITSENLTHTWVNPATDHLVMLRGISDCIQICCGISVASGSVGWVGFICWDLTNCCVSEVTSIYPGYTGASRKWFDYLFDVCGCPDFYDNPRQQRWQTNPCCPSSASCNLATITPYGDYSTYLASNCTDKGGVVMLLNGFDWMPDTKAMKCCFACYSKYFGCFCSTKCLCSALDSRQMQLAHGNTILRVPHERPLSCYFKSEPFLAEVFTYMFNPSDKFNLTSPSAACQACFAACFGESLSYTLMPPLCGCSTATNCPCDAVFPCAKRLVDIVTDTDYICICGTYGTLCQTLAATLCNFNTCARNNQQTVDFPTMISGFTGKNLGNADEKDMSIERFKMVRANYKYPSNAECEIQLDNKSSWALRPGEDMFCRTIRWWQQVSCCC